MEGLGVEAAEDEQGLCHGVHEKVGEGEGAGEVGCVEDAVIAGLGEGGFNAEQCFEEGGEDGHRGNGVEPDEQGKE